jgi:hypothetical protein
MVAARGKVDTSAAAARPLSGALAEDRVIIS